MSDPARSTMRGGPATGLTLMAMGRLERALGVKTGRQCAEEALGEIGLSELRTMQDLLEFSNRLLRRGGVVEVVGRALKVSALLRGAKET